MTNTPPPPEDPLPKKRRRSLFKLSRKPKVEAPPPISYSPTPSPPSDPLRPIQWAPNRLETLYVTPSERNLYLAAMSQLDQNPPPLPLWTEAPPVLPSIAAASTFQASPPLRTVPLSPKLVTSPNLGMAGLQIRDEFRGASQRPSRHALLALALPSTLKFTGFPAAALAAVDEAITQAWPPGVRARSESVEQVKGRKWKIELQGKVWRRRGNAELDTIRLMLAIMTALGVHGWSAVNTVQAASTKADAYNILFAYSPNTQSLPPAFFALAIPLPDRIALVSPPPKATPALISAVRSGIGANAGPTREDVDWNRWSGGIKEEGWVDPGVYRFWLGGMRRWLGGGLKNRVVENVHPQLFISVIDAITSAHFQLVASLPLLPVTKGRDILIFASLPGSGISHRDTYVLPDPDSLPESPVVLSPEEAEEAREHDPRNVDPEARQLPWTSRHLKEATPAEASALQAAPSTNAQVRKTPSSDSQKPLIPEYAVNRHRNVLMKRNSLRRRGSAGSATQGAAREMRRTRHLSESARPSAMRGESWEMVDGMNRLGINMEATTSAPAAEETSKGGILAPTLTALHTLAPTRSDTPGTPHTQLQPYALQIANPTQPVSAAQLIAQEHSKSQQVHSSPVPTKPMYVDSPPTRPVPGIASTEVPPLPLGGIQDLAPLRSPRSPKRGRVNMVDVGGGIGVSSMVASVGFTPSVFSGTGSDLGRPGEAVKMEQGQNGAGSGRTKITMS